MADNRRASASHGSGDAPRRRRTTQAGTPARRTASGTGSAARRTSASGTRAGSARPAGAARSAGAARPTGAKRRRPANGAASQAQARKSMAYREAQRRRRNRQTIVGIAALVLALLLVIFAVRGIAGCVSRVFAPKQADQATQEATQEQAKPKSVQVDLVMIGDILFHFGVRESGLQADGSRNYDHVYEHILGELEGMDIKVVNLETILGGSRWEYTGFPTFNGPQEMGDAEAKAGFNVVLRATNHAMDMGYEGLSSELSFWKEKYPDIHVIGAADPYDDSTSVDDLYVYEKDGFKIALLNFTYDLNGYEDPEGAVSMLTEDHVRNVVTAADAVADMVVVFPHWGEEYNLEPVQEQYDMARVFMDCGADVIIGGHPHVIEPVEILTASDGRKVPCFWSVGNFISTMVENECLVGGLAKVTMVKDEDGNSSVTQCSFIPTITHKGLTTDMTTYLLRDFTDDLAPSNFLESNGSDNSDLTVAWANNFCTQVLGSNFDTTKELIYFGPEWFAPDTAGGSTQETSGESVGDVQSEGEGTEDDYEEYDQAA